MNTQVASIDMPDEDHDEYVYNDIHISQDTIDAFEVHEFSVGGWIKFIFGLIFLFPFRLILTLISVLIIMLLYLIFFCCIGPVDKPQPKIIRVVRRVIGAGWARFILYLYGFFWISEHGKIQKDAKMVIANHSSCFDMFYFIWKLSPSFVVAEFVGKNFFLGPLSRVFNCPVIDRKSSGNSSSFLSKLQQRLESNDDKYPPCMIFPEGATSNGQCLNYFHSGAFVPGAPMQPIVLHYKDKINPTQWSVRSWPFHYLTVMCNLTNNLEVIFLPVYYPSQAEKEHPRLYAQNVKNSMSCSLSLLNHGKGKDPSSTPLMGGDRLFFPQTQLTYRDRKLYEVKRKNARSIGGNPQPRAQWDICKMQCKRNMRDSTVGSSTFFSGANLDLPVNSENTYNASPPPSSSSSVGVCSNTSTTSEPPKDQFSFLLFALPPPPESFDFHQKEYHSQCTVPSEQLMQIIEPPSAQHTSSSSNKQSQATP
ncbi:putative lysophosphatidylcholine acyltransferase / lyso-PAF acetyltransferase [Monocercomonoides exilis]|uniref:putative lysophosphatidylcholine acyltransferase / lyso-PAF acetyltransferase n=1 Tax=Monocercomonoides exilis TaxID=2049356 RepID=UPI00355AA330|nr:putative lysophosphatidylcholine acyltransferase / lyso-PAF acetyltransferase [Monocercomonoides exilis]|eukprot:MONOS_3385.1-p1 / transcript=MONOS_3385.1 / gene=MONOS_3385 / organism=Monocercomonoides_exilis_PA203 / gene_product= lysophosphatidylcholine acyltransferase / lyso-PAF acetyltransferase [EC:2.3.1.23 2.3.1.67] / transcript_product= lysophosphatidylcholine acyltransferase / lyso-PAF acetyltransferase [EC:2.3.1.23 2.3.1.67] / location=Mono_scaffold00079:92609-94042(-) / protein_length=478 / sequence_SO=supercontig / SO=protein_coding / is_pseudo=false